MRKTVISLLCLAATLTSCGGSDDSTLAGAGVGRNFIRTTVNVDQSFLYALSSQSALLSGFVALPSEEEEGPPELAALDGSPFGVPGGAAIDMVGDGEGRSLYLLDSSGRLSILGIDGLTGLLTPVGQVTSTVANARLLRISNTGDSLAVLGDELAIYQIGEEGLSAPAILPGTQDWTDVRLSGELGVGATATGAVGFSWSTAQPVSASTVLFLPGANRGQAVITPGGVYVVNSAAGSLSRLSQQADGSLALLDTFALPAGLANPETICAVTDDDLIVGDSDSLARLHAGDDLEAEAEVELDQIPTVLFPIPDSNLVLAGHGQGFSFTALATDEDVLEVVRDADDQEPGASAFAFARRAEEVTRTTTP